MAWSKETEVNNGYSLHRNAGTIWDGGTTLWDVHAGVEQTVWDPIPFSTPFTKESEANSNWSKEV